MGSSTTFSTPPTFTTTAALPVTPTLRSISISVGEVGCSGGVAVAINVSQGGTNMMNVVTATHCANVDVFIMLLEAGLSQREMTL